MSISQHVVSKIWMISTLKAMTQMVLSKSFPYQFISDKSYGMTHATLVQTLRPYVLLSKPKFFEQKRAQLQMVSKKLSKGKPSQMDP